MALSKRQMLAATVLTIIAIAAIAYAQAAMGTISLTTTEAVSHGSISDTFPARSAGARVYKSANNNITLALDNSHGFKTNDKVLVRVELVPLDVNAYAGFRALVIQVLDVNGNVKATLTPNTPYDEFEETISTLGTYNYCVRIIFATGVEELTANIGLRATIVGIVS
jgi:hypothetical protein